MGTQQFYFKWKNYEENMMSSFKQFLTTEHLMDVTLSCEGRQMKAHKLILSASSSLLKNIFQDNPHQYPIIVLTKTKYSDLKMILDFVYNGEIFVPSSQLAGLLKTAELLKIDGLGPFIEAPKEVIEESTKVSTSQPKKEKRKRTSSSESDEVHEIPSKVKLSEPPVLSPNLKEIPVFTLNEDAIKNESVKDEIEIIENPPIIRIDDDDNIEIKREEENEMFEIGSDGAFDSSQNQLACTVTSDPTVFDTSPKFVPTISKEIKISDAMSEMIDDDNDQLSEDFTFQHHFSLQSSTPSLDIASTSQNRLDENVSENDQEETMSEQSLDSSSFHDPSLSESNNSKAPTDGAKNSCSVQGQTGYQ
ncbi:protein bric-a-brac 2-like isoform X2 [Centruroides sculpturatus]|uniref:protein bric-a-brac 2-like isoform X2 n=1 Tax=Centruroides sculpturatus TaxID=218467 RepID=UPI000C6D5577|nr:protein bric-a-brac 2-like isoform X2 [Centruroides sculpturatus]